MEELSSYMVNWWDWDTEYDKENVKEAERVLRKAQRTAEADQRLMDTRIAPLVKAVQQGWASMAELARSPWAAPVVMSLMIVALKLVGSMEADVEEAGATEAERAAAEGAGQETDGTAEADGADEEADGAADAAEDEDAIDAAEFEEE